MPNPQIDKASIKQLIGGVVFLAIVGGVFVLLVGYGVRQIFFKAPQPVTEVKILRPPTCVPDLDSYQLLRERKQFVSLVSQPVNTYAVQGQFVNDFTTTVYRSGSGEIACGYLYIHAKVDGRALNDTESIFINPSGFGGHILRSKSVAAVGGATSTEVLLPLRSISYLPSVPYNPAAQNYRVADWAKLINAGNQVTFGVGLSTLDVRGVIEDISIAYKCWDPSTGEETEDCQLSIGR